jgi:hypothetical protein
MKAGGGGSKLKFIVHDLITAEGVIISHVLKAGVISETYIQPGGRYRSLTFLR